MRRYRWIAGALVPLIVLCAVGAATASAATIPGRYIVVFKDSVDHPGAVAAQHRRTYGVDRTHTYRHALKGYAATIPDAAVSRLRAEPDVLFVSPEREVGASSHCIGRPEQCVSEGIERIDGGQSSTRSGDGAGAVDVNVAVIDTGTEAAHPDLNVVGGVNCVPDNRPIGDDPDRQFGHGTHVGGIVGARDNDIGVVGVAPGTPLWSARALGASGNGQTSWIICAIDWAAFTHSDADPGNDIAVVNMSLGGPGADDGDCGRSNADAMHLAICNAVDAGITVVAAAGNEAADLRSQIPAAYQEVLSVTALADYDGRPGGLAAPTCHDAGADDTAAIFSNFATLASDQVHTVAAPGVCIRSTYPPDLRPRLDPALSYLTISGTSMASPHVAGAVALCIASGSCAGLSPAEIIAKFVADSRAYNESRKGRGYGFLGDPLRPIGGEYYGYLIRASLY